MTTFVKVRSTHRRFKPLGEIVDVTKAEAEALIAEGTAEYVKGAAGEYTTRVQTAGGETGDPPAAGGGETTTPKGRHERRDMRAKP